MLEKIYKLLPETKIRITANHTTKYLCKSSIDSPLPWQSTQDKLSPGRVAQAFPLILAAIGTPSVPSKTRGKSPGRIPGHQPSPRPTYPTVKKRASKKLKTEESLNKADSTAA